MTAERHDQLHHELEPLTTRAGMMAELVRSTPFYPTIMVIVSDSSEIPSLQALLATVAGACARVIGRRVELPGCEVHFGSETDAEKYCGTIPVFYDPGPRRNAA